VYLEAGSWELETQSNWKLETGNWELRATGNWKLETEKAEPPAV
jgi:hypothetical protein